MVGSWRDGLLIGLETLNQILAAGIAITAFSLVLYALTFNLRDRVARSFAIILVCVLIVFTGEAIGSVADNDLTIDFWLRFQWIGLLYLPPAYLHFSDALLSTTGKPSHGRRRWLVRVTYLVSTLAVLAIPFTNLLGPMIKDHGPAPYLERTIATELFTLYYAGSMVLSWFNFVRAFQRTITTTGRRRMVYLLVGASAPAMGSFPYMMFGSGLVDQFPLMFWSLSFLSNLLVGGLVVVMAYAAAFFGVAWPDRVVRRRLFKWIMRGPVTAGIVLAVTTLVRRLGAEFGMPYTAAVPIIMVITILLMEYLITLFAPLWERWLFATNEGSDITLLRNLEDRLLTRTDLNQFIETILAAICDRLQAPSAFVAGLSDTRMELIVQVGDNSLLESEDAAGQILEVISDREDNAILYTWDGYYLIPLKTSGSGEQDAELIGILGVSKMAELELDDEELLALEMLSFRIAAALKERKIQQELFLSLQALEPQVELIQRFRAASRYNGSVVFSTNPDLPEGSFDQWVKDALSHYWGGPKLTESPLLKLKVVQNALTEYDGNSANALRAILRQAIDQTKPEGDRRFTGEWILYNILEMKFLEGKKVREIAMRLAMSEADLYRKQRVAIETVAQAILDMEENARESVVQQ